MPGLTDAHTHASGRVPHTAKGAEAPLPGVAAHFLQAELRDYLRLGVTTIRVCGSQGLAAAAGQAGHALRRVPRPPPADLRQDHLGHGAGRALLRRHVPRGRRARRHQAGGQGADQGGRGLRQGDDDRRPVQRARGPGTAPAHRAGAGRRHRRGPPARLPGGGARRGPGRLRGGDQARRGHHRARHVPAPAPGPAGGDGRRGPGPGAHAVGLLLDGRPGRDGRPGGRPGCRAPPTPRRRTPTPACRPC